MSSPCTVRPKTFTSKFELENLTPDDVPRFIGKGAMTIKNNVKVPAWRMFSAWQKKEKIQDETKNTLFVKITEETGTVSCEVQSTSEELHKFAVFIAKKSAKEFNTRVFRHTFYASMDHSLIPLFIGQKGKSIQTFLNKAVDQYDGEKCPFQSGNPFFQDKRQLGDLRLSIESLDYYKEDTEQTIEEASQKMMDEVEKSKFIDFVGWQPSTEEYEQFVKISISVYTTLPLLDDIKEYLSSKLNDYIGFIEKKDKKRSYHREQVLDDIDIALQE